MNSTVWQSDALARKWLSGVRSAIPLQAERLGVTVRLLAMNSRPVRHFLDLGCGDGVVGAAVLSRGKIGWRVLWESAVAGCN